MVWERDWGPVTKAVTVRTRAGALALGEKTHRRDRDRRRGPDRRWPGHSISGLFILTPSSF